MRRVTISDSYSKYKHKVFSKWPGPLHVQIRYSHSYPTPGCILHDHPRRKYVFERHVSQGNKANMLYWRLHPSEYNKLINGA